MRIRSSAIGLVVGLHGTGDQKQTIFTTQMLANVMLRMGLQIAPGNITVKNIAAVFVTSSLPAFTRAGTQMDVVVSSIGDAKSLEGGTLLLTPLRGEDGQIYATAQGPLAIGGYSAGAAGVSKQLNHPTVGRIANGAIAERDVAPDLHNLARSPCSCAKPTSPMPSSSPSASIPSSDAPSPPSPTAAALRYQRRPERSRHARPHPVPPRYRVAHPRRRQREDRNHRHGTRRPPQRGSILQGSLVYRNCHHLRGLSAQSAQQNRKRP